MPRRRKRPEDGDPATAVREHIEQAMRGRRDDKEGGYFFKKKGFSVKKPGHEPAKNRRENQRMGEAAMAPLAQIFDAEHEPDHIEIGREGAGRAEEADFPVEYFAESRLAEREGGDGMPENGCHFWMRFIGCGRRIGAAKAGFFAKMAAKSAVPNRMLRGC